eukprot:12420003-Karenia_brevis.AAC.1
MRIGTPTACLDSVQAAMIPPPFPIHESHVCIVVGGFFGCIRCGGISGFVTSALLESPCRKHCPHGSRRPITRLSKGLLPYLRNNETGGYGWPSGVLSPTVQRYATRGGITGYSQKG